jgi:hypothetical protein
MNQTKIIVALSLLAMGCIATTLSSRQASAGAAFTEGAAVAVIPPTLPKPPHRPKPSKAAPSAEAVFFS